jgi:hypothetical protein
VIADALLGSLEDGESSLAGGEAAVGVSTLHEVSGGLAAFGGQAKDPAGFLLSAGLFAFVESVNAGFVLFANFPEIVALLLDTVVEVWDSNRGLDLVEALVVDDALPEGTGGGVALSCDTGSPAGLVFVTGSLTVLEGSKTAGVAGTGLGLVGAVIADALLGSGKDGHSVLLVVEGDVDALVLDDALDVFGGVGGLGISETLFPAVSGGVALIVAEGEGGHASSVVFAGLLFVLAVLLDALLGAFEGDRG